MFTTLDKALVAVVMAAIYFANNYFGFNIGISADAVNALIVALTPFFVWLLPNKKA